MLQATRQHEDRETPWGGAASGLLLLQMDMSAPLLRTDDRQRAVPEGPAYVLNLTLLRSHALTIVLFAVFVICLGGELASGHLDFNRTREEHGAPPLSFLAYVQTAQPWEAMLENWESEFLEMTAFILLTAVLCQKGSPESRRPGAIELVDADPRAFAHLPEVPWPVKRGGWILAVYERSLGLMLALLFLASWCGHALTGWRADRAEDLLAHRTPSGLIAFVTSAKFWFQTMQNWQSEFFGIAAMIWLGVYLRQRGSPASKPVHASHVEMGR